MGQLASPLRRRLFGIDPLEVTFARRGFAPRDPAKVERLERAAGYFVKGYMEAQHDPEPAGLARRLDEVGPEHRGFAFEGAGMALALLDRLTPWRRDRLASFLAGAGEPHTYMVIIGAGWAWARLGARIEARLRELDPVLGWLALDGYGFHETYFHPDRTLGDRTLGASRADAPPHPRQVNGYACQAFDTGLGRALWFVCCALPDAVAETIARFPLERRPQIWAGIGLAASYAGGCDDTSLDHLRTLSREQRGSLAQGAAFAAKARERAGTPAEHTQRAVARLCRCDSESAAKVCDIELARLSHAASDVDPAFERWRRAIRQTFERQFDSAPANGVRSAGLRSDGAGSTGARSTSKEGCV